LVLISVLLCGAATFASAQQRERSKPPAQQPRTVEVEVKDPQAQAAILFEAGQKAHEAGKLEEALRYYDQALERDPALWQAEFQRATAYLTLNRLEPARASITRAIELLAQFESSAELRRTSALAQVLFGEIALAESKMDEAERAFRRALELHPPTGRAHTGLAEIFLAGDKFTEAAAEAKAALSAGDERASTYTLLGEALVLSAKYDEAMASLDEALKREPQNPTALRYRAEVFLARGDLGRATADLKAALAMEKITPTMLRLAEIHRQAKQYTEAAALYDQVLAIEPANAEARTALAVIKIEAGKASEAITELEALIKAEPNRADLRAQLAELYLAAQPDKSQPEKALEQYTKALEQYQAAARLEPTKLNHQIGMGSALVKLRRFEEAAGLLRRVLQQEPPVNLVYFAHTNLATALFGLEDYQGAAREYVWILGQQTDQRRAAITLYFLGICFDKLGDYEQALKAYEQFLELAPKENQLEIDKVKLRLPSLQRQLKEGKGRRKRP
jgi:tetratricopeptide (TPR) repeat protein